MNIAICDDEQQDIDILYNYCKSCKLPYNISTFLSASALLIVAQLSRQKSEIFIMN